MASNSSTTTYISKQYELTQQKPLDAKTEINSLRYTDDISFPYIGLVFFSKTEKKHYKVTSLKDGYLYYSDDNIYPVPEGVEWVDYEIIPDRFIGTYEEFGVGGSGVAECTFDTILTLMRDSGFDGSNEQLASFLLELWDNKDNIVAYEFRDLITN